MIVIYYNDGYICYLEACVAVRSTPQTLGLEVQDSSLGRQVGIVWSLQYLELK